MKKIFALVVPVFLFFMPGVIFAQVTLQHRIDSVFNRNGEIYFKFRIGSFSEISHLTKIISIDNVNGKEVFAYASPREFEDFQKLDKAFELLQSPGSLPGKSALQPENSTAAQSGMNTVWNFYPTYDQYVGYMVAFANNYPAICRLDTIGTTVQGRLLLAVKISDSVHSDEAEPQMFYTSSIHGDETTGYVLMLHLIDHLLSNYGTDPDITDMINNTEIFINPLANPDGTYHGGNSTVYGAVRYNANSIDLNRNYPDPQFGQHPDGNAWQPETVAFMNYATINRFSLSTNFHGGSEVFNYPWDTWSKLTADDDWWQFVGREWADTVHKYSPAGYFTDFNNGITNGYAWYTLNGGRQDYMNYFQNCREVTVEISNIKTLPVNQLLSYWGYNYHTFLNYIREARYGFNGVVTDTVTDVPLAAKIYISGHDKDNSEVYSHLPTGFYARPIYQGNYDVTVTSPGYFTKTIRNVSVSKWTTNHLDIQLRPLTYDAQDVTESRILVYPNPSNGKFKILLPEKVHPFCSLQVVNLMGNIVETEPFDNTTGSTSIEINMQKLPDGVYFLKFNSGYKIYLDKLILKR